MDDLVMVISFSGGVDPLDEILPTIVVVLCHLMENSAPPMVGLGRSLHQFSQGLKNLTP